MRVLVFGCKGQLGRELMDRCARDGAVEGWDLPEVDIAEAGQVNDIVARFGPDLVINAAAYTDVDRAEDERDTAFKVNAAGSRVVAQAAVVAGVPIVYYSTDFVFDGQAREPYTPEAEPSPLSVYGASKLEGERETREANPKHFILRTAWLYGLGGNNFVEKILRAAAARPSLQVVEDEAGSPTYTRDLAEATVALSRTEAYGIYHAVNAGACSRYAFAQTILRLAGVETPVAPCASGQFPTKARRPVYSVLSNAKLEAATGYRMRAWDEALKEYIERRQAVS